MDDDKAIEALAALAQPTRLAVVKLLTDALPDGIAAGDIARSVGTPQNTMSTHLGILHRAGQVEVERQSRAMMYRAKPTAMTALDADGAGGAAAVQFAFLG